MPDYPVIKIYGKSIFLSFLTLSFSAPPFAFEKITIGRVFAEGNYKNSTDVETISCSRGGSSQTTRIISNRTGGGISGNEEAMKFAFIDTRSLFRNLLLPPLLHPCLAREGGKNSGRRALSRIIHVRSKWTTNRDLPFRLGGFVSKSLQFYESFTHLCFSPRRIEEFGAIRFPGINYFPA